ncbi:MAG TPA: hypothetical protein PLN89_07060, partial [Elusimicrobiota bacterium]|nr:hypothetical protein [Elusimicrobiota bacterium]
MNCVRLAIAAALIFSSFPVPGFSEESGPSLSLDDLGFKEDQTRGNAELQNQLHRRSRMLKTHQILGLATAVPLIATVMTAPEYESATPGGVNSETKTHRALGVTAGAMYLTTA